MCKMEFLLKFIASNEICFIAFPMKNPAVVCHNTLKTHFTLSAYALVPGECVIYFILFIYIFGYALQHFDRNASNCRIVLSDYTKR